MIRITTELYIYRNGDTNFYIKLHYPHTWATSMYFVYIIETEDGTYYTGQTNDLARRFKEHMHSDAHGATYLRMHKPRYVVHLEHFETRSEAVKRELEIKNNPKLKKDLIGTRRDIREVIATEESYK